MKLLLLLTTLIYMGCSQRIKVPINRMISPEVIGGGIDLDYKDIGFSEGKLDFSNGNTSNPLNMGASSDNSFYMGIGINEKADLFVVVPQESSSLIGLKVQFLGAPSKARGSGHNMAFTMAMGAERDKYDSEYTIKLKSEVKDYSLIHGYRFSPMLMVYEGLTVSQYKFSGTISGVTGLSSNDFDYEANNILGVHAGLEVGGVAFKFKIELGLQQIEWSHTDRKTFYYTGTSLNATL